MLLAVHGFDEAAIFTIHGFCQRALQDAAFEAGGDFDSELTAELSSQAELIADHSAAAISNARIHNRVLFLKTWKFFGRILEWFHGRKLAKTLAILTLLTAVIMSMTCWRSSRQASV